MPRNKFRNKYARLVLCTAGIMVLFSAWAAPVRCEEQQELQAEMDELGLFMSADQLVEAATRSPKPISQVAENVTIITAKEIEAMNAHTVAEVLNRVPGIIMEGSYTDFGSKSDIFIQGSDYEHVLVLVDGVRWGYVSFDFPETLTIPVQIIKRIEVIKGAASSTWGSSLGGVVNIITKDTGTTAKPAGTLSASYGESSSMDLRADAAGQAGPLSYYLYAGHQESDGLKNTRFHDNQNFYGKVRLPLPSDMELQATIGYSQPDNKYYYLPEFDDQGVTEDRAFHATMNFSAPITDSLDVNLSAYSYETTFTDNWQMMSTGMAYNSLEYEGKATGANGRLVWDSESQTVVLGAEIERRENTDKDLLAPYIAPTSYEETWAVFVNDTIRFENLTVTPGLRYDHLSIDDDILSPSLGLTYKVNDTSLLRANVASGYRKPINALQSGDPYFHITNPDLESETIWSYQIGAETTTIPNLRVKATLFDHQASDVWVRDPDTWAFINNGDYERQGIELELLTASFHNFSAAINGMYLWMKPEQEPDFNNFIANILLQYDDTKWQVQLFGHYIWVDDVLWPIMYEGETGTFIWDAVAARQFKVSEDIDAEVFAALHNIFDEDQYFDSYFPNAQRWIEAGVRIKY